MSVLEPSPVPDNSSLSGFLAVGLPGFPEQAGGDGGEESSPGRTGSFQVEEEGQMHGLRSYAQRFSSLKR